MTRRRWSDEERAAILAAYDANGGADTPGALAKTATECGVSESTLRYWIEKPDSAAPANLRAETKANLRDMWARIAAKALGLTEAVLDAKESAPDPKELRTYATTAAIATDKEQLLSGEPTSRTEHVVDIDLANAD